MGEKILLLSPTEEEVWEALRALYLVGQPEDIAEIEPFTGKAPHMAERTRQQARLTVEAIKKRNFQLKWDSAGIDAFWLHLLIKLSSSPQRLQSPR